MTTRAAGSLFDQLARRLHLHFTDPGLSGASRLARFYYESASQYVAVRMPGHLNLEDIWEAACGKGYFLADDLDVLKFAWRSGLARQTAPSLIAAGVWRRSSRFGTMVACLDLKMRHRYLYLIPWSMVNPANSLLLLRACN